MNKEQPVTLTLQELDNTIFTHLTAAMAVQFPNEHRTALKVAMRVADGAMAEFEAVAKRQSKSGAARIAAETRWASPQSANAAEPTAADAPLADGTISGTTKKRNRRTKAQIAADHAAQVAAMTAMPPLPGSVPPAPFTPDEQQAAAQFGTVPPPPLDAATAAAIAAASGSPVNTPTAPDVPPPPPLQIPTFGQP